MITALMLLPVLGLLTWLYRYLLPRDSRWRLVDTGLWLFWVCLAGGFIYLAKQAHYENAGPLWPDLVAATGAYLILACGLAGTLASRRARANSKRGK